MSLAPIFRSPFTDLTGNLISHQYGGRCKEFEMNVIDCLEAYGLNRGREKCDALLQDFKECHTREKQEARHIKMRYARMIPYWLGEKSKAEAFAPDIRPDSF